VGQTTAGSLALLGVVLGISAAYLALIGAYSNNLDRLGHIPVAELAVTALGVPVLATAAGWLLAGRQPPRHRPGRPGIRHGPGPAGSGYLLAFCW